MVTLENVNNVLRRVSAAQEQVAAERVIIFFDAQAGSDIDFPGIDGILKGNSESAKNELISKLKKGVMGDYVADNFKYVKVYYQTPQNYVYVAELNNYGGVEAGKEVVYPKGEATMTPDELRKAIMKDTELGPVINLDLTIPSFFVNSSKEPSGVVDRMRAAPTAPVAEAMDAKTFRERFMDRYRVSFQAKGLRKLDLSVPKKDGVSPQQFPSPGGGSYYPGNKDNYEKLLKVYKPYLPEAEKEKPQDESLGEKMPEKPKKPTKSKFEPVGDEAPVEGDVIGPGPGTDKKAAEEKKRKSKGDYASEPYSGGTDVMQRLVKDQRKQMDIRRAAQRVVASLLKEALVTTTTPATGPTGKKPITIEITDDPEVTEETGEAVTEHAKSQKKINEQMEETQKRIERARAQSGMKSAGIPQARHVVEMYLR